MNSKDFKELMNKIEHELIKYDFVKRVVDMYIFKGNDQLVNEQDRRFISFMLDNNIVNIKVYKKVYEGGQAVNSIDLYDSSYRMTALQQRELSAYLDGLK